MFRYIIAILTFGLMLAFVQAGHVSAAPSAVINVSTLADEFGNNPGACSLREAIQAANTDSAFGGCAAGQGADTILLPVRNLLTLTRVGTDATNNSGDLDITSDITILGRHSTIDANGNVTNDRAVEIHSGQVAMLDIRIRNGNTGFPGGGVHIEPEGDLTLENCNLSNNRTPEAGGAISNYGTLTLDRCTLTDNQVPLGSPAEGGALSNLVGFATIIDSTISNNTAHNRGGGISNRGQLLMIGSTLSDNSSGLGGGLDNNEGSQAVLVNSTVSGNTATGSGGGIFNGVGSFPSLVHLINVTVTDNIADSDANGTGSGGGVINVPSPDLDFNPNPILRLRNSLVAKNLDLSPGAGAKRPDCDGEIESQGRNLIGSSTGCTGLSGDLAGTNAAPLDPKLGGLANNGGPTRTHALLATSPAIDGGGTRGCRDENQVILTVDQRGSTRPTDGDGNGLPRCDIGAFELGAVGIGAVSPNKGSSERREQVVFDMAWDSPTRWRDLTTLDLRFKRGKDILLWLRFTEALPNSTISLLDKNGNVVDSGNVGVAKLLKNKFGSVDLSQSGFTAAGPDDPHVVVHFAITFKGNALGKSKIQMLATDDFLNAQGPEPAGTWKVE